MPTYYQPMLTSASTITSVYISDTLTMAYYDPAWTNWCSSATSTNSTIIWTSWANGIAIPRQIVTGDSVLQQSVPPITPEQQEQFQRYQAEQRAQAERAAEARAEARGKARRLLEAMLDPEQHHEFLEKHCFKVRGASGQLYRIRTHRVSANVEVLDPANHDRVLHRLCCHYGDHAIPEEDHFLGQMLMLQHDEERFVRTANRHAPL